MVINLYSKWKKKIDMNWDSWIQVNANLTGKKEAENKHLQRQEHGVVGMGSPVFFSPWKQKSLNKLN